MVLRVFRGIWFISLLGVLIALLYVYAGLPQQVIIQEDAIQQITISKETFFYAMIVFAAIINALVFLVRQWVKGQEAFKSWFHGLIICLNIFFIVAYFMISSYNSFENFNFNTVGFIIYGSVGLMVLWAITWPVYSLTRKFFTKQLV
jgi:hypothetical protein